MRVVRNDGFQVEIMDDGLIQVRFLKCDPVTGLVFDPPLYHRCILHPMSAVDATLALVSTDLQSLGCAPLSVSVLQAVKRHVDLEHTPVVKDAFRAARAADNVRNGVT